ncbi:MAG: Abi family protein [Alcanivorax sp.]|nr:Abi family protein [Alcanivorax sp.]
MDFNKPARTLDEQVTLLRERGLRIDDRQRARHYLKHLNYYRLTAYWLPFEAEHQTHQFEDGACFEDVLNLYVFDREFRLLLLDAIERVEVSLRTIWAYQLAHLYGPHAYLEREHASRADWHQSNLRSLKKEIHRSDEIFIQHYLGTYKNPELPPIWSACEVMSFGLLSRWLTQLKPSDANVIAKQWGFDQRVLKGFVRHLTYIRNLCAHHSRVWNRSLTVTMPLPRSKPEALASSVNPDAERRIYNTIVTLVFLLDRISPGSGWKERLLKLLERHEVKVERMGFPPSFGSLAIWRMS